MYYLMQPSKVYKSVVSTRLSHQSLSVDSTTNNYSNIIMQVQLIIVSLVALAVFTSGEEQPKYTDTIAKSSEQQYAPMPHSFAWEVKDEPSKNDYSHQQESDGKVTTGSYRVALPDGRTQIVTYTADQNGYVAQVKYEGEAQYPAPSSYNNKPSASYPTEQAKPTTAYPVA